MRKKDISDSLVAGLVASQFPQWADLPIKKVDFDGHDNSTYRLGEEMSVRLPCSEGASGQVEKEQRWLPRLAPHLPLPIPVPLAKGTPTADFPWPWSVFRWLEGEDAKVAPFADPSQTATSLGAFLAALQRVECHSDKAHVDA